MHILITADTVGGVWTYCRELVAGLVRRGMHVTLVSFGDLPSMAQLEWMDRLAADDRSRLAYYPTAFKLEWMQDSDNDMKASAEFLLGIILETGPDLLHFNQYYFGALRCEQPRIVVAHSDVMSWWAGVHGSEPPVSTWISWYRYIVARGLNEATQVVAPSHWMLDQVERHYLRPHNSAVIYNGRTPGLFNALVGKQDLVLTVGRLWDAGKNAALLLREQMPLPVAIVGADHHPDAGSDQFRASQSEGVRLEAQKNEQQMVQALGRASIYAALSQYEPFGLAPVEAALSRCAIVASDIPSFRELWEDAAIFFRNNDPQDLRAVLELLARDPRLRSHYAEVAYNHALRKFTASRMVDEYAALYRSLVPATAAA
jgi:glycosyltransferase involved in cell wall biosynthesis